MTASATGIAVAGFRLGGVPLGSGACDNSRVELLDDDPHLGDDFADGGGHPMISR
jgi:hypothetical protein